MTPNRSVPRDQQVYRALSSPVRARLLEVLGDESDLDAAALAERLGLHVNTVRSHLNLLGEAGLIEAIVEDRDRPGRPKLLYRAVADRGSPEPGPGEGGYRFLAQILASHLDATSDDAPSAAEQAGHAWGSFLVDKPAPFTKPDAVEAVTHLVDLLDRFGFAPELDGTDPDSPEIVLRRCPFLEVARDHQDVVCAVHLGLMRGALKELGVDVQARELLPWADREACLARLTVRSSQPA
ncbi:MAG: helix-turn-helix transcriptional regulator [Nitriliruptoraceae bacterium]